MENKRQAEYNYRYFLKRALYSFIMIFAILLIGTLAFHYIENYSYVDAFYFISMLATAEGPAVTPATALGKVVASIMAFVSVGTVVVALIFLFGPFLGKFLKIEEQKFKEEERSIAKKVERYEKKI